MEVWFLSFVCRVTLYWTLLVAEGVVFIEEDGAKRILSEPWGV